MLSCKTADLIRELGAFKDLIDSGAIGKPGFIGADFSGRPFRRVSGPDGQSIAHGHSHLRPGPNDQRSQSGIRVLSGV